MSPSPTRLALVRHGETAWNAEHRYQGRVDLALSGRGQVQAQTAAAQLKGGGWQRIVTSPLRRARMTAEVIAQTLGLPSVQIEEALIERSFGIAEGIAMDVAAQRWPQGDFPGAESLPAVARRSHDAIARIIAGNEGQAVIVVCHVVIIREIGKLLTQVDPGFVGNGSITGFVRDQRPWRPIESADAGVAPGAVDARTNGG